MTDKYILNKDHLTSFLRRIRRDHRLVAPVKNQQGDTAYTAIQALDRAEIDLTNQPQTSAKLFFLPPRETLFTFDASIAGDYTFTPIFADVEPTIYFGLRSCDLSAILYMDVIFLQQAKDPYYLHRRRDSILISIGCNDPFANCFCYATRNGPFLEFGFDLQFTDLGNRFFVQPGRVQGEKLIRKWQHFFQPATEDDIRAQYQISLEARGNFKQRVDAELASKRLLAGEVPAGIFEDLSRRCQDCGGCAYICPTCTCFTITDHPTTVHGGERIRSWDACTFSGFTKMAGGHNPVIRRRQGIEKRFRHKLQQDVKKHGRPSCMGCGRCVGMCFDGVDIIRFINAVCEQNHLEKEKKY
jgi:sulfhydrogenase subunit beta (sulfur reductase)